MRTAEICTLSLLGGLCILAFLFVALEIPGQMADYDREPEDTWLVICFAGLLALMSFSFLGAVAARVRGVHSLAVPVAVCSALLLLLGCGAIGILALASRSEGAYQDPVSWMIGFLLIVLPFLPLYTAISVHRRQSRMEAPTEPEDHLASPDGIE